MTSKNLSPALLAVPEPDPEPDPDASPCEPPPKIAKSIP